MEKMVIVFDLDHTLYDESEFVLGGMRAVADDLSPQLKLDAEKIFQSLMQEVQRQRNHVFDRFLAKHGIKNQTMIRRCVSIYRTHDPQISLLPEAYACLKRLKAHPLYVVTDGNKLVQKRKFLALGLAPLVKRCLCTYAFGKHRSKPSPYCFEKICKWESVSPLEVVYIGDDPSKDFFGIKPKGFKTIRLLKGPYAHMKVKPPEEANLAISSLTELDENMLRKLIICS